MDVKKSHPVRGRTTSLPVRAEGATTHATARKTSALILTATILLAIAPTPASRADEKAEPPAKAQPVTIKGEVLDLGCYLDHGASDPGLHAFLRAIRVLRPHKPLNKELAPLAGKTITLKGKLVTRSGVNLIENVEVVK